MQSSVSNTGSRHTFALISAFDAGQITVRELAEGLEGVPSEVLQVTSTVLALLNGNEPSKRILARVRRLCMCVASINRSYN